MAKDPPDPGPGLSFISFPEPGQICLLDERPSPPTSSLNPLALAEEQGLLSLRTE